MCKDYCMCIKLPSSVGRPWKVGVFVSNDSQLPWIYIHSTQREDPSKVIPTLDRKAQTAFLAGGTFV